MPLLIEHGIVLFCVTLALLFLGWRLSRSIRRNQGGGCNCGSEKGCAKLMATMEKWEKDEG